MTCEFCGVSFNNQLKHRSLAAHVKNVHGNTNFECLKCGKSFKTPYSLTTHEKDVHGEKSKVCDECGKAFTSDYRLNEHKQTHLVYDILCPVKDCGCKFPTKHKLASHMTASHKKKKEKKFKCEECGKMFDQPYKLKNHIAVVHRGERPYKCDQCDQTFCYSNALKEHKDTIHEGVMFTCQYCSKQMNRIANLNKHMVS